MANARPQLATCSPSSSLRTLRPEKSPSRRPQEALEFCFAIADERPDVLEALQLVYSAYVQQGLIDPHPSGIRITKYHLLPTTEVLTAKSSDGIVCTATLVRDNLQFGLPMEAIYGEAVEQRRRWSLSLAEASCLACRPGIKIPLSVVTRVMGLTIQCAKHRGADELLAVVHPDHADFYTGFFGFESFGDVRLYPSVRHHPAVAISLDLHRLQAKHPKGYKRAFHPAFPDHALAPRPLNDTLRRDLQSLLESTSA